MRRILLFIFAVSISIEIHAQIDYRSESNIYTIFNAVPDKYIVINDVYAIDAINGENVFLQQGTLFSPSTYDRIELAEREYNQGDILVVGFKNNDIDLYISIDDIVAAESAVLSDSIVYTKNSQPDFYWIPSYAIDIIQHKERDAIFLYDCSFPKEFEDAGIEKIKWYDVVKEPQVFEINNFMLNLVSTVAINKIEIYDSLYKIFFLTSPDDFHNDALDKIFNKRLYAHNIPRDNGKDFLTILLENNGNLMRVYNGETKRIILDLVKVSPEFYDNYKTFIKTDEISNNFVIPQDLLDGWNGDIRIDPPFSGKKSYCRAKTNLRVRSSPNTASETVDILQVGDIITVLEPGLSADIDGITAPWVWVQTVNGYEGWCFSGYLEPVEKQNQAPNNPEIVEQTIEVDKSVVLENKNTFSLLWILIGMGIVVFVVALVILIRRKNR
jgi:hypothetical protein